MSAALLPAEMADGARRVRLAIERTTLELIPAADCVWRRRTILLLLLLTVTSLRERATGEGDGGGARVRGEGVGVWVCGCVGVWV